MGIKRLLITILASAGLLSFSEVAEAAKKRIIFIGTGGVSGIYYPTGISICNLVNKGRKNHGVRCSVESTDGSIYNINTIRAGEMEFGVVQSSWQYHAYHGTSKFKTVGPFKGLRSVFSVHPEPVTIVAQKRLGIEHIDQLKDRRLIIGSPGDGASTTWAALEAALGWDPNKEHKIATVFKPEEQSRILCDSQTDALLWLVAHPSIYTKQATASCDTTLVNVTGPPIDRLVEEYPFYRYSTIFGGMYRGAPSNIKTFGVGATLVASTRIPAEVVYTVVKSVFGNFKTFKNLHPAFAVLKKKEMIKDSLTAPLHEGAITYYKEANLM